MKRDGPVRLFDRLVLRLWSYPLHPILLSRSVINVKLSYISQNNSVSIRDLILRKSQPW